MSSAMQWTQDIHKRLGEVFGFTDIEYPKQPYDQQELFQIVYTLIDAFENNVDEKSIELAKLDIADTFLSLGYLMEEE